MKRSFFLLTLVLFSVMACKPDPKEEEPVIQNKIASLVLTVKGEDYVAVPVLDEQNQVTNNLTLEVKIPSSQVTVKTILLADPKGTVDIKDGDVIEFIDNTFTIHYTDSKESKEYVVTMSYNPPPFLYVVKSSDRDAETNGRYFLDVGKAPHITAINYDNHYEGFLDLTSTNWDNLGIVASDKSAYYEVAGGLSGKQSYAVLTLTEKPSPGNDHYPSEGPWGDWTTNGDNTAIVSPGYWLMKYDSDKLELTLLETQWAISGSAIATTTAMTCEKNVWKLSTSLNAGTLKFVTIPVTEGDPTLSYGKISTSEVAANGEAISVEAGNYDITLDLSNSEKYTYSLTKK